MTSHLALPEASSRRVSLALLLFTASLPRIFGAGCPSFAGERAACSQNTCGHYIYRGRFALEASAKFLLPTVPNGIKLGASAQPSDCCLQCRAQGSCSYWAFAAGTGVCQLYTLGLCEAEGGTPVFLPGEKTSFVGGKCHSEPNATAGAGHTAPATVSAPLLKPVKSRAFCLLSDPNIHVNMLLGGYLDNRTFATSAKAVTGQKVKAGPSLRVWIRELAVMWGQAGPGGQQHVLRLQGRQGRSGERGTGFLGRIEVDGSEMPRIQLGDEISLFEGQSTLLFDSYSKEGLVDVDVYSLKIQDSMEAKIKVRPAHPLLREEGDAMVHLVLDIEDLSYSPMVHGVMGQFYKEDRPEQALDYRVMSSLMAEPFSESFEETAKALHNLDGDADDYATSDVISPDCKFSQFMLAPVPELARKQIELERAPVRQTGAT